MTRLIKKALFVVPVGVAIILIVYLARSSDAESAQIQSALRNNVSKQAPQEQVSRAPKLVSANSASNKPFSAADDRQLATDITVGFDAYRARIESYERTRGPRDVAFREELKALQSINSNGSRPTLAYGPGGSLRAVSGSFELEGSDQAAIESFIGNHKTVFGLSVFETPVISQMQDSELGRVYHIDRKFNDYPVWGRQLVVSESKARVRSITGKMQPIPMLDTKAELDEAEALEIAQASISDWSGTRSEYSAQRGIFVAGSKAHFVYRVDIASSANKGWQVYVSINNRQVLSSIVKHYENTSSQGTDLQNVTRSFQSELASDGVTYVLKDGSFPAGTSGTEVGFDDPESDSLLYVTSADANSGWRPSAVSAIHNARTTYEYFLETHGRNSFNANAETDSALPLVAIVDVLDEEGVGLDNAYWYAGTMYYGKGSFFNNLAVSLDVAAHEFGHGVVEYTAGLRYHNQSGALNESFADLFGAMVDRDDWLIGEDLYNDGQALRDMETPENGNQPSTFMNYRHLPDTREGDWGGVHINSGIQNRAFYLLAEGLSLEGLGVSIGKEKLEQIAYQALLRLGEDAEFIDAYLQMKLVAEELYGSETLASVEAAWDAVGISEAKVPQSNDVEIDFVLASGSDAIAYLYPVDETFDYDPDDSYDLYVYFTEGLSTQEGYIRENDLGPINDYEVSLIRPAVYSIELLDGNSEEVIIYVNTDGQLVLADALNRFDNQVIESEFAINSVAISPDGDELVLVPRDSRIVLSVSLSSDEVKSFEVLGPSYSNDETDSPVQTVDSINFDYTGSKIIFDFLSCRPNLDGSECISFWSIGIVDIDSGSFDYPFPGQDEYIDLGYPQFSNINDEVFVFDFLDYRDSEAVDSLVLAYNRLSDEFSVVGSVDPESVYGGKFSLPTVRGNDESIVYQVFYTGPEDGSLPQEALYSTPINDKYEGQLEDSDFLFPFFGGYAESHRSGVQDLNADLIFSVDDLAFGEVTGADFIEREVFVQNTGARDVEIGSVEPSFDVRTNLTSTTIKAGETLGFVIGIRPSDFDLGELSASVEVEHDGDSRSKVITISAKVVGEGASDDSGADDSVGDGGDGSDGSGSGGGSGGLGDDADGDGLPDDRDPQPQVDNSDQLARYKWVKDRVSWSDAQALAAAEGGYLASITSQLENDLIYALVSDGFDENSFQTLGFAEDGGGATYVYIGASDQVTEGVFLWDSGESFEFENWGRAEPDNFNDDQDVVGLALETWPFGATTANAFGLASQWNDISATNELTFVIEFDESQDGGSDDGDGGSTDSADGDGGSTGSDDAGSGSTDQGGEDAGSVDDGAADNGSTDDGQADDGSGSGEPLSGANLLDIDADGERTALSDGLLIIRHLFGFKGDSLISGALSSRAEITDADEISAVVDSRNAQLDVDEDGETRALTDGLLIIRHLFGFEGQSLVSGAVGPLSDLSDTEIAANLRALEGDGTPDEGTTTGGDTTGGGADAGDSGGGSDDDDDDSGGGSTDDGETGGGSGSTDGGSADFVDIQLSVLYERVYPVVDTSSGFYSARLDYEGAKFLPGRLLDVSAFDAETDQEFVPETAWRTDKAGQLTAVLPIDRQFYFKVYARTDVEGIDGTWRVSVHDNQGVVQSPVIQFMLQFRALL